jgi:tetratricopeptide (TPR) repeat protein
MEEFLLSKFPYRQTRRVALNAAMMLLLAPAFFTQMAQSQQDARESAIAAERAGRNDEAEAVWQIVAKAHPTSAEPYAHLGLLEARQQHYPEAIHYYLKARKLSPKLPGLSLNLGLAYFKNGDYKETITEFTPLLKAQNEAAGGVNADEVQRLTVLLGMSHYGLSQFKESAVLLKQASEHDPTNLALLLSLAHSCLLSKDYPCVLDTYHKLLSLNPDSVEAHMFMGESLDEMGDRPSAISEFRAAVTANPKEPNVHFGLGYLLWKQKQYEEASVEFQAELANDPEHVQSSLYQADALVQLTRYDAAAPLLEALQARVKKNDLPDNAMLHLDLGIVYTESDHKPEALSQLELSERLNPQDADVHWRLGRLYRSMGKTAEAKAELDKVRTINQNQDKTLMNVLTTAPASSTPTVGK